MDIENHVSRVRRICPGLPGASEKLSHGTPTFFAKKKVFAMFASEHRNHPHTAVWIPAAPGFQSAMIDAEPNKFFRPPYVGFRGWVGVELSQVDDEELGEHILTAWRIVTGKRPVNERRTA